MSGTIPAGSERLTRKTALAGPPSKLNWSMHFGVLGQVCMLESEKASYKLSDCVETSRLVVQCKNENKAINIAAPKRRSLSVSGKPVLSKKESFALSYKSITTGVRNCIEVAMAMSTNSATKNDSSVLRSLEVKTADKVLDAMPKTRGYSITNPNLDNQEYKTFPEPRPIESKNTEPLTPFQAVKGLSRGEPAYWISCQYGFVPQNEEIEMVVRQTGVLPETKHINKLSKITLEVKLSIGNGGNQKKRIVLKKSGLDNSFKSSKLNFSIANDYDLRLAKASFRIYVDKTFSKKVVSNWELDLSDCPCIQTKSQISKVVFTA